MPTNARSCRYVKHDVGASSSVRKIDTLVGLRLSTERSIECHAE
jgi:hypothetical protein